MGGVGENYILQVNNLLIFIKCYQLWQNEGNCIVKDIVIIRVVRYQRRIGWAGKVARREGREIRSGFLWERMKEESLRGKQGKRTGKAVPLQACSGSECSRKLRFPDCVTTAQDGGKVVSLTHRPLLPPGNTPGTHFCQRLSRPHGHGVIGRILCQ